MIDYEKRFQEEMNEKFVLLNSGKVTADFGSRVTFIPTHGKTFIEEYKKRYPTEYKMLLDEWFDNVHCW